MKKRVQARVEVTVAHKWGLERPSGTTDCAACLRATRMRAPRRAGVGRGRGADHQAGGELPAQGRAAAVAPRLHHGEPPPQDCARTAPSSTCLHGRLHPAPSHPVSLPAVGHHLVRLLRSVDDPRCACMALACRCGATRRWPTNRPWASGSPAASGLTRRRAWSRSSTRSRGSSTCQRQGLPHNLFPWILFAMGLCWTRFPFPFAGCGLRLALHSTEVGLGLSAEVLLSWRLQIWYRLTVYTSDLKGAGTDANIDVNVQVCARRIDGPFPQPVLSSAPSTRPRRGRLRALLVWAGRSEWLKTMSKRGRGTKCCGGGGAAFRGRAGGARRDWLVPPGQQRQGHPGARAGAHACISGLRVAKAAPLFFSGPNATRFKPVCGPLAGAARTDVCVSSHAKQPCPADGNMQRNETKRTHA